MAQSQGPVTGQKRGPGRPPKNGTPAMKKLKTSQSASSPPHTASPAVQSPTVASPRPERTVYALPLKISDNKALPTVPTPQAIAPSNDEYQSIAASAVLAASLDRSRRRWINDGIFQRYWVKPGTGKNAAPPPPNNPEVKWMKLEAPCRIRIEPHIFEVDVYVEKKPRPPPPKQYIPPAGQSAYVQPYRPPQPINQSYQGRVLPPVSQPVRSPQIHPPPPPPVHDGKGSPDPVISMLASRASSDPELKALMKEVATGNANQEQLRVFQRHIDGLSAIIQKQKREEEDRAAQLQQPPNTIQYESPQPPIQLQQHPQPLPPPPPVAYQPPIHTPPPPAPPPATNLPVILAFTNSGASDDRFLFPEHSILEPLSPQHLLVSFMVVRKGSEAADPTRLDAEKEYWQPVTMMVEVAFGREEILAHIRRWVRPPDAVRTHMEEVMERCQRAPAEHLALRLPVKGSAAAALWEIEGVSKEATPVLEQLPTKYKSGVKRASMSKGATAVAAGAKRGSLTVTEGANAVATPTKPGKPEPPPEPVEADKVADKVAATTVVSATTTEPAADKPEAAEGGRPRRALRKSVRISEG